MQSYDELNNIVSARQLSDDPIERMRQIAAELELQEVARVSTGELPVKSEEIAIHGLVFVVKFVDYKRGSLQLVLKKYKQDEEDMNGITHNRGEIATFEPPLLKG